MEKLEISQTPKIRKKRDSYGNQFEYILLLIGFSVGFGNLWRFPYLVMDNDGAAFVIPYFVLLFVLGWSLMLLEQTIGQFNRQSLVKMWDFAPVFRSLGWCFVVICFVLLCYFPLILAWVIYYTFSSFNWTLPWSNCNNPWNTPFCYDKASLSKSNLSLSEFIEEKLTAWNLTQSQVDSWRAQNLSNFSFIGSLNDFKPTSSSQEFWLYNVLELSSSIAVAGGYQWKLSICLIVAWILIYGSSSMGIKSTGKVVYVTALLPYVLLTVLVVRGLTLPGASIGLKYYLETDIWKMLDINIWRKAAIQVFYTLGPGWGGVCLFASFSKFSSNFIRDSALVTLICGLTSFYAGFAIFSVIGHMAHLTDNQITSLNSTIVNRTFSLTTAANIPSGPGLIFIVYPEALSYLPGSAIWAVIFFIMMINIGLDTVFSCVEVVTTTISEEFNVPKKWKPLVIFLTCLCAFFSCLICTMRNGYYILVLTDHFIASLSLFVICFLELVAVTYFYNFKRVFTHIELMLTKKLKKRRFSMLIKITKYYLAVIWYGVDPFLILLLMIYSMINLGMPKMFLRREFPDWCFYIGAIVFSIGTWPIVIIPIYDLIRNSCNVKVLFRRTKDWRNMEQDRFETMQLTIHSEHQNGFHTNGKA